MGARNLASFVATLTLIYSVFAAVPCARELFAACSSVFAAVWMAEWLMQWTRKHLFYGRVSPEGKAVLITGCDSGFGHALAIRMDSRGYRVFAGCLDTSSEGATDLTRACSARLFVLPLDVTSEQSVQSAKECVHKNIGSDVLWCVVNNAGISQCSELDWTPTEDVERIHQVNTFGTVRVSKAFLPLLKKSKGRLVNNASAGGRFICPGIVGYCMSKCATIAFSEGLRVEMMKWGVKVISIEPFFYQTAITHVEWADTEIETIWRKVDPSTRDAYREGYLENFRKSCRRLLSRSSPKVHQVIDCFEDAIAAEDPLSTYFPAFLPDKIGIKVLQSLPKVILENYQRLQLDGSVKPSSLVHDLK